MASDFNGPTAQLQSDGSGNLFAVINDDPSGFQDWSSMAAIYDEYRTLGMRIEFSPKDQYSKTTTVCRPVYTVVDRDSGGPLSSLNQAVQFESCQLKSLEHSWVREVRMQGDPTEARFLTTASPAPTYWFKFAGTGLSLTTTYGTVLVTILVQFRGRN
jgi:hypothetical protein